MALINEYLNASAAKINIPTPFILKGQAPLDLRQIVQKREDLTLANFYDGDAPFWYPGMLVSCVEDSKVYILKKKGENDYEFVEVTPDLPENATKNTTYDLAPAVNTSKGQIQLSNSDDTSVDSVYIEGGSNISVSSTTSGITVAHTVPTEGTALSANETAKDPGYGNTFTAVTGLTKDANGHIVAATLETIKMPGAQDLSNLKTKQTAVGDATASGVASTAVTSVTQNENGEITVTKANLPSVTDTAIAGQYVSSVTQTNGKITVTHASFPAESVDVDSLDGATGAITTLKGQTDTGKINLSVVNNQLKAELVGTFDPDGERNKIESISLNGKNVAPDENRNVALSITAADLGLGNGVHFIGTSTTDPSTGVTIEDNDSYTPASGDIVLYDGKEYIYSNNNWVSFGDEGSYALKTVTIEAGTGLTGGGDLTQNRTLSLAEVTKTTSTLANVAHGGQITLTTVSSDNYGRVTGESTQTITDIASAQALTDLSNKVTENEKVTAASLNDLNGRINGLVTGVSSVKASTSSSHVTVTPTTSATGDVEVTVNVASVDASTDYEGDGATGLATDAYVREQVAASAFAWTAFN